MKTVWKYEIDANIPGSHVEMPAGARIVHVEHQRNVASVVTFWAEVEADAPIETRVFTVVGTGHRVPAGGTYVGTGHRVPAGGTYVGTDCVSPDLVLHLYEITSAGAA